MCLYCSNKSLVCGRLTCIIAHAMNTSYEPPFECPCPLEYENGEQQTDVEDPLFEEQCKHMVSQTVVDSSSLFSPIRTCTQM
jgi:hypothetical protein